MTRKDYELIASILREAPRTEDEYNSWYYTCVMFANELEELNPRFDRKLFLKNCGIEQEL